VLTEKLVAMGNYLELDVEADDVTEWLKSHA
jgi:hypothetical protein